MGLTVAFVIVTATLADDFTIDWYTVDGGGAMLSTGDEFEFSGTTGQADAGEMSGAEMFGDESQQGFFEAEIQ